MQRLNKRGDTWWTTFYVDGRRVRVSTGCRDRKAAELRARELERRAVDPTHAAANETTLRSALEAVLPDRAAKGRAEGTISMYRSKAGHLVRLLGADLQLARVDAAAVDRFVEARLAEGAARSTIHKELTTLRVALKIALRRGLWTGRIEAVMPEGFSLEYVPKQRALTRVEYDKLVLALRPDRARHVAFIVATGARWIESVRAVRLDVGDDEVFLRGSKTYNAARTVPLVGFMRELVAKATERPSSGPHRAVTPGAEARTQVSPSAEDAPKKPRAVKLFAPWSSVRRDLAAACERAGIAPVTPNDLRRTCATWLRAAGVEPSLIAVVLGHRDSRMVERVYGRIPTDALRAALEGRLGEKTEGPAVTRRAL